MGEWSLKKRAERCGTSTGTTISRNNINYEEKGFCDIILCPTFCASIFTAFRSLKEVVGKRFSLVESRRTIWPREKAGKNAGKTKGFCDIIFLFVPSFVQPFPQRSGLKL